MSRPVQVIVVAYGQPALLEATLAGLAGELSVHVVDNSSDPHVEAVARRQGARYTDPGHNGGFASGVNIGLREVLQGSPVDVLLLNPDATLSPAGVRQLAEALHADGAGQVGAVSPAIAYADGSEQRVMWPFPHPARAWLEALGGGRWNLAEDYAVGTALLLKWEALRDVGIFDERFFLYAEETDWQRRSRNRGWSSRRVAEVKAVHVGGATSVDHVRREVVFLAAGETYIRKWFGASGWQSYRMASLIGACLRSVALPRAGRLAARRRLRVYIAGPRRLAGMSGS